MTDRLFTAAAGTTTGADFFADVFGRPRKSEAEKAEADARRAKIALAEVIHKIEYQRANREREALLRDRIINGEQGLSYEEWHERLNRPLIRAAERVNRRMAELEHRRAA
jgi:hypothetical protein